MTRSVDGQDQDFGRWSFAFGWVSDLLGFPDARTIGLKQRRRVGELCGRVATQWSEMTMVSPAQRMEGERVEYQPGRGSHERVAHAGTSLVRPQVVERRPLQRR